MREERIVVGGRELVLTRPDDPETLIDEDRFERDEFLPYWAELWPSGIALAEHVAGLDLRKKAVLELGCGLGLPSLAAALVGAEVLATDWAPEALELLAANAAANGLRIETAFLDWHAPVPDLRRFDVILAADVVYEPRNAVSLLAVLAAVVSRNGVVLVADPGRIHAPAFTRAALAQGWSADLLLARALPAGGITVLRRVTSPADDQALC